MRVLTKTATVLTASCLLVLTACDTDVVNPGRVQDDFLDKQEAFPAVVAGMGRALSQGVNWISYTSAAVAREIHPSGSTGSFGITVKWQRGELDPDDDALDVHWNTAQRARWFAEDGVGRMVEAGASQELLAQAYLWAGFANRLLGENMCQAVIDGGSPEPHTVFFQRAEGHFSKAAELGTGDVRTAAIGGRAQVRVWLGDWSGAVSDAGDVTTDFEYKLPYHELGEDDQRNRIMFASAAQPYKAHTQWNTKYAEIGLSDSNPDGDPRVPYMLTDETGDAAIDCCGKVPWWPQLKYPTSDSDIVLVGGDEMRLIEAESLLEDGDVDGAMAKINAVRAEVDLDPLSASSAAEAWALLKEERGIALWLEARRLGDLRRWSENDTPGELHPLETASGNAQEGSHLVQQDLCFPIPPSEQDTNPNVGSGG